MWKEKTQSDAGASRKHRKRSQTLERTAFGGPGERYELGKSMENPGLVFGSELKQFHARLSGAEHE